jgi:xylulokinase
MRLLLGLDLGTSYFKVGLFSPDGALRGLGRVRVVTDTPVPGYVELPVERFVYLLRSGLDEALRAAGAHASDITGVSYSSQASTFLLLDAGDRPLTPLVMWTDTRGAPIEPEVAAFGSSPEFHQRVGHAGFVAESLVPKLRWFRRERPEIWARVARVMTISDYLTFLLTGQHMGDASTAAFLGLQDLRARAWWPEAFANLGLDVAKFSRLLAPGAACGCTGTAATALFALPQGVPFAVGAIDHHAAAVGAGLGSLAEVSISTGTVLAALALVERIEPIPGCYHGPHTDGRRFYRLAFDADGAGKLEDHQRRVAPGRTLEELLAAVDRARREGNPDPVEAGVLEILTSVAHAHSGLVAQVSGSRRVTRIAATGGGARSDLWLRLKAEALGATVVRPAVAEPACLGAAIFAAAAARIYPTIDAAAAAMVRPAAEFAP